MRHLWFPEIGDREDGIESAHAATFNWMLEPFSAKNDASKFMEWLLPPSGADDSNRIFWVSGKAGSGKSTMMKYLYQDPRLKECLQRWAKDNVLTCIGFFIWDRGKSMMHKSREGMVRSLLHQILAQHRDLIPVLFPKKWSAMPIAGNIVDRAKPENPCTWDWSELYGALTRITNEHFLEEQGIPMRLCVFVDGMDEYRTSEDPGLSPNELIMRKKKGYMEIAVSLGGSFEVKAENARKARKSEASKVLQKGGVLYSREARHMNRERLNLEEAREHERNVASQKRYDLACCKVYKTIRRVQKTWRSQYNWNIRIYKEVVVELDQWIIDSIDT